MNKTEAHLLSEEIEGWKAFADALRHEDREAFKALIEKVWQYSAAIESSKKRYLVEPFFLTILLMQQRTINWLQSQLDQLKKEIEHYG